MTRASRSERRRSRADATGFEFVHLLDDPATDAVCAATPSGVLGVQLADDTTAAPAPHRAQTPRIEIEFLWAPAAEPALETVEPAAAPVPDDEPTTTAATTTEPEQAEVVEDVPLVDYEMGTFIELAPIPATPRLAPSRFALASLDDDRLPIRAERSRHRRR